MCRLVAGAEVEPLKAQIQEDVMCFNRVIGHVKTFLLSAGSALGLLVVSL